MSADKPPAGHGADQVRDDVVQQMLDDPLDYSSYTIAECRVLQAELRRVPALEAEQDEARRTVRMAHELGTAIAAERDQLRAEVEALREANSTFATAAILPDDKVIVDKAEIEALRADAERYKWVRNADRFTLERMIYRSNTADDFDAAVDAARKQQ